jgi:hypothetical protein
MSPTAAPARLRLLPAPSADPPFDDEVAGWQPPVDGTLALAFPGAPASSVPLRLVPPALACESTDELIRTARADLPDPRGWTGRLTQAVVEVLAGARPAGQLSRFATLDVLDHLERLAGRLSRRNGQNRVINPRLVSVRVSEPLDGVVEACAVVDTNPRRRALALRLEGIDGRWQCTALQLG